jgi:hypothetical protein
MTQYINKSTIKAEIERLVKEYRLSNSAEAKYRCEAYGELLDFINSLQEEPVSEDLEEAADNYVGHAPEIDEDLSCFTKRNAFIAGAKWKKEPMIERACEYMRNHIDKQLTIYHEQTWKKRDEFIKDFKNYMKGE